MVRLSPQWPGFNPWLGNRDPAKPLGVTSEWIKIKEQCLVFSRYTKKYMWNKRDKLAPANYCCYLSKPFWLTLYLNLMEELRESLKIPSGDRSSSKIIDCRQAKSGFSRGSISDGEFFINRGIFSNSWRLLREEWTIRIKFPLSRPNSRSPHQSFFSLIIICKSSWHLSLPGLSVPPVK